jgi:hypothetical protein
LDVALMKVKSLEKFDEHMATQFLSEPSPAAMMLYGKIDVMCEG